MNTTQKFEQLVRWYADVSVEPVNHLLEQQDYGRVGEIHRLIEDVLPADILALFERYDGESAGGAGAFLGHGLMSFEGVIGSLIFARTLIKPVNRAITDPGRSGKIIQDIVKIHTDAILNFRSADVSTRTWHKLEFDCSPGSYSGPYFYEDVNTSDKDRTILSLPSHQVDKIYALSGKLHALEYDSYNWDELKIILYGDGTTAVERSFYNFDEALELTSFPVDAIRKKYFHIKWVPLIQDYGGNYIGVDMDPGPQGTRGQIIVFGRDEEAMYVLADSWEGFLDLMITRIEAGGEAFKGDDNLHDILKPGQ